MVQKSRKRPLQIEVSWPDRDAFLEGVKVSGELTSFFYAPPKGRGLSPAARVGRLLSVVIRFEDVSAEFHVHARVIERQPAGRGRGLRLEFLREEASRQDLVLACARGESVSYRRRRSERVPCRLRVRAQAEAGQSWDATATTISRHGLHLSLDGPPPLDTMVELSIALPGRSRRLNIWGRVASIIAEGPQQGVGVEFSFTSAAERDAVAEQVAILRSRGRASG